MVLRRGIIEIDSEEIFRFGNEHRKLCRMYYETLEKSSSRIYHQMHNSFARFKIGPRAWLDDFAKLRNAEIPDSLSIEDLKNKLKRRRVFESEKEKLRAYFSFSVIKSEVRTRQNQGLKYFFCEVCARKIVSAKFEDIPAYRSNCYACSAYNPTLFWSRLHGETAIELAVFRKIKKIINNPKTEGKRL